MFIKLNGEKTECYVEKVYSLRSNEIFRILSSSVPGNPARPEPDIPKSYDREMVYRDKAGKQHCVLAFGDTPLVPHAHIVLAYADKKTGDCKIAALSATDFLGCYTQSSNIPLDHLAIKLHAVTEYLLEQRRIAPKDADFVVRYSKLQQLFSVNFAENKDFALIVGELLHLCDGRLYTDIEPGSIAISVESDE